MFFSPNKNKFVGRLGAWPLIRQCHCRDISALYDEANNSDDNNGNDDFMRNRRPIVCCGHAVDGRPSRGKVDGVILYACIGSACLASILVGASVVACRRRTTQSRNVASNQRLQLRWQTVDKHPLSAFDMYVTTHQTPFLAFLLVFLAFIC